MKKYKITARYKGGYYRMVDTNTDVTKTIKATVNSIDAACEWICKHPSIDDCASYLTLESFKVDEVTTTEIDINKIVALKETDNLACGIQPRFKEWECVDNSCKFFGQCKRKSTT